jgi:superoxide dismutase, Cu-Zn family
MRDSVSSHLRYLIATTLFAALTACGEEDAAEGKQATATISALGASGVSGNLTITAGEGNVTLTGTLMGLAPASQHGFHLHETGNCGDATAMDGTTTVGGAAGGHWNPAMHMHGAPEGMTHLGDLGNLTADAAGVVNIMITKAGITVGDGAMTDVIGRAVIVHANPDDLTSQPVGNAGGRMACGVVQ